MMMSRDQGMAKTMTRLCFKLVSSLKNRFLGISLIATRNFCLGGFVKDSKGHVMMQKGQEMPNSFWNMTDPRFKVVCLGNSFYLPHMEYEESIGFVMRKMKIFYC
jgi:hypothetical protein